MNLKDATIEELEQELGKRNKNEDGDSLVYMEELYSQGYAIDWRRRSNCKWTTYVNSDKNILEFETSVYLYRITAKYADIYDAKTMDFETWARGVLNRGMICKGIFSSQDGSREYYGVKWDYFRYRNSKSLIFADSTNTIKHASGHAGMMWRQ